MTDGLLEALLHEEESSSLDFKRDQYPFVGASDDDKGELLKDILAFANSWRRSTAYILIGVEEVKGGRGVVHGVSQHLADNDLQQFVNSKTNRTVTFSYAAVPFEGKQVGIINVPKQERPVFLTKDFGKLKKQVVYVRQSSSTAQATPDEGELAEQRREREEQRLRKVIIQSGDAKVQQLPTHSMHSGQNRPLSSSSTSIVSPHSRSSRSSTSATSSSVTWGR